MSEEKTYFVHPTAIVDDGAIIGDRTKIWHFSHVMSGAELGAGCVLGQNVFVASKAKLGHTCKVQNNVSLYDGVILGDEVFCGPSMVFTNVSTPRSHVNRRESWEETRVGDRVTFGANSTVVCGHEIGDYAFVGAGATVACNVPPYALMLGVPARRKGWVCACGVPLKGSKEQGFTCPECSAEYTEVDERLSPKVG